MQTPEIWQIVLGHQILFQGMFFAKNILLQRKLGQAIRGNNSEATSATVFFALFIATAFGLAIFDQPIGYVSLPAPNPAYAIAAGFLLASLAVAAWSLLHLRDSWRVGILENQQTALVTTGIYGISRNPYFLSYILLFLGYTVLLQNLILLAMVIFAFPIIHKMIKKEEAFLQVTHSAAFSEYKQKVPRYLFF